MIHISMEKNKKQQQGKGNRRTAITAIAHLFLVGL